ncbi:MAG: histidine phosphatase family protein [Bacillota bacterium]
MAIIGMIRHGITEWDIQEKAQGLSNVPLNEEGRKQAKYLGMKLKSENWDLIITSNLIRAKETAEIIAYETGVNHIIEDVRIREIDCGRIEGMTEEQRIKKWGSHWRELDLGMERFDDVACRGVIFLEEICDTYKDMRVLVVSHGALIGLSLQRLFPELFSKTYINNASLTLITKESNGWTCILYNDIEHLRM